MMKQLLSVFAIAAFAAGCGAEVKSVFGDGGGGSGGEDSSGSGTGNGTGTGNGSGVTSSGAGPGSSVVSGSGSVSGSSVAGQNSVGVGPNSSSSGGSCDQSNDCDSCIQCSVETTCSGAYQACFGNMQCTAFVDCLDQCQNENCANQCAQQYPNGVNLYIEAVQCIVCTDCYFSCDGGGAGC